LTALSIGGLVLIATTVLLPRWVFLSGEALSIRLRIGACYERRVERQNLAMRMSMRERRFS